jgi:hypothetical protein
MFEQRNRSMRLAGYLAILALVLATLLVGCKKSQTEGAGGPTARRAGGARGGRRGAQGGRGGTQAVRGAEQPGARGQTTTAGGSGGGGRRGGPGGQAAVAAGVPSEGKESAEAATARLLAEAVKESGVKAESTQVAEAATGLAPRVEQLQVIGDKTEEAQFVKGLAILLKEHKDLLEQAKAGKLPESGVVLTVRTVAGTEVQKAAKIQRFAALYGPVAWTKERNWDGRLIEWVMLKHQGRSVKLPASLIMDARRLSILDGYFWIYNDTGVRRVASKQTITAPAGMKEKVLAEEKLAETAAATAAAKASEASAAGAGAGGGADTGGGGRRRGGGRGGGRRGGGMMGG